MNVKSWLRRIPQPASVRLDKKQLVRVGEGKNKWRDVYDVILTNQPRILEALDSEGSIIRVTELASEEEDEPTDAAKKGGPNTELAQIGALVKEAWLEAAKANREQYESIIQRYTELAQLVVNRNSQLENAVEKTWEEKAAEIAAGGGDLAALMNGPLGVLVNAVMGRMLQPKSESSDGPKNGKTNGKRARK